MDKAAEKGRFPLFQQLFRNKCSRCLILKGPFNWRLSVFSSFAKISLFSLLASIPFFPYWVTSLTSFR